VLANAAGGLRPAIGQPVLISAHLNLTARSPLLGAQFVGLTDAYAPRLRQLAHPNHEVLRRYVVIETSGQKVCNFFVCMTTMLSTSRGDLLTPSQQPVARSFARLRNEALKDLAERQ
jgi:hypothetical protein